MFVPCSSLLGESPSMSSRSFGSAAKKWGKETAAGMSKRKKEGKHYEA